MSGYGSLAVTVAEQTGDKATPSLLSRVGDMGRGHVGEDMNGDGRGPTGMTPYEAKRWSQIAEWHAHRPRSLAQRVPEGIKCHTRRAGERVADVWEKVPGNDQIEQVIANAIQGSFHFAIDTTCRSISEERVTRRVLGRSGGSYADLQLVSLPKLDGAAPSLKVSRSLVAAAHGAAAGFVAGGSTAAGAASGGMGALPAAMAVAGSAVFDAGAVAIGSIQATALLGAHYGYDPSSPAEHAMMMSVLSGPWPVIPLVSRCSARSASLHWTSRRSGRSPSSAGTASIR